MAEYIEREALIKEIASHKMSEVVPNCFEPAIKEAVCKLGQAIKKIIENHPAANVVEVRHGEWKFRKSWDFFVCSKCSFEHTNYSHYCPNCGAKMDGKGDGE